MSLWNIFKRKEDNGWLPWWWYLILIVLVVIGVLMLGMNNLTLDSNIWLGCFFSERFMSFAGVLLITIPISHLIIFLALKGIKNLFELEKKDNGVSEDMKEVNLWSPSILGILELFMFVIALFLEKEGFIGVWLVFKVASQWVRWGQLNQKITSENASNDIIEINRNRRRYMHFLIGNALMIIFSFGIHRILICLP